MYLTIAVYLCVLALILWGGKFAGIKGFHEDSTKMDATMSLRGLAAALIPLHHVSQEELFQNGNVMGFFLHLGFYLVAIFLFCSGFGLIHGLKEKENYLKGFFKKRMLVILVPFYTSAIIYTVYYLITLPKDEAYAPLQIVTNLLGLTNANEYAWYPITLMILYLAFYLIFKHAKNIDWGILGIFGVIVLLNVLFAVNGHFAWWAGPENWWMTGAIEEKWWMGEKVLWFSGEWWVNSAIAFPLGMLWANHEESIMKWLQKGYFWKLAVMLLLAIGTQYVSTMAQWHIGYWSEFSFRGPRIGDKLICLLAQAPEVVTFTILIIMVMMKYYVRNPITKFLGKYSYEYYLMNLLAITICHPILDKKPLPVRTGINFNYMLFLIMVIIVSLILAIVVKLLNDKIVKLIRG